MLGRHRPGRTPRSTSRTTSSVRTGPAGASPRRWPSEPPRGIEVRVLYDWLGCIGTRSKLWRFLREAGAEVRAFNRPRLFDIFGSLSRDHRKLVVADGRRARDGRPLHRQRMGGRRATGPPALAGHRHRDRRPGGRGPGPGLRQYGPGPAARAPGPTPRRRPSRGRCRQSGSSSGSPAGSGPTRCWRSWRRRASNALWITDAYMVPPPRLFQAFQDAARDGVDIRLLVPGSSDVPFIRNLTRIGYRDLLRTGVRIFEWDGPMLHAKTVVADGRWTRSRHQQPERVQPAREFRTRRADRTIPACPARWKTSSAAISRKSSEVVRGQRRASLRASCPSNWSARRPHTGEHRASGRDAGGGSPGALWTAVRGGAPRGGRPPVPDSVGHRCASLAPSGGPQASPWALIVAGQECVRPGPGPSYRSWS